MGEKFLTATLYAPFASFGGLAVGERRSSERYPTRSMLIGLLGAALGVNRADEPAQQKLAQGYHFAIQIFGAGRPFTDYHTAQMPSRGKTRYATRREELAAPELNTVLTSRDYRTDFLAGLAVAAAPGVPYALEALGTALRAPHYTLSFGRKSCAFGLPLDPAIAEYADASAALAAVWESRGSNGVKSALFKGLVPRPEAPGQMVMDTALLPPGSDHTIEFLRDQPLSRKRWQFALREVAVLHPQGAAS
jgi:CRISPR system Cascade subunit CasD